MAWGDDPVGDAQAATIATGNVGTPGWAVIPGTTNGSDWVWNGSMYVYGGTSAPASAAPAATVTPPHLQFTNQTIGATTMLAYGRCRLPGQLIWAAGIDASTTELTTSYLTFATAYCEPIDPAEPIRIQRMWANGTLFYDFAQGGAITVANIDATSQADLNSCIASMEFHKGGPGELPSHVMEDYLGVGNVPAHRGLRTIVFQDFPLIIANNSVPNINVEFYRTDTTLLNVSSTIVAMIGRYLQRNGMQSADPTLPGYVPIEVDGVDDTCYGLVVSDSASLLDKIGQYSGIYKYQILDGQPIKLRRRPVDSGLVIDYPSVAESSLTRRNGAAAISFQRSNPAELPAGLELRYMDPSNDYDISTATARHEGTGVSNSIARMSSDFVLSAADARALAFDVLYKSRAEGLRLLFEMDDLTPEVGDTIEVTDSQGNIFVCLVEQQTQTKTRSSQIRALNLLTVAGADINGDNYRDGGSTSKLAWPESFFNGLAFDVDSSADRIWTFGEQDRGRLTFGVNFVSAPLRKISHSKWIDFVQSDVAGANWGGQNVYGYFAGFAQILHDEFYFYFIQDSNLVISRIPKTSTSVADLETIVIPAGFFVDGSFNNDNIDYQQAGVFSQIKDGKLYRTWSGSWNGSTSSTLNWKLIVIDLEAWSPSAYAAYDYAAPGNSPHQWAVGMGVTDDNMVVIATVADGEHTAKYYYANLSNLSSWSSVASSLSYIKEWRCAQKGHYVYFQEGDYSPAATKTKIAVINTTSGGFSETIIDLHTQDSNYISHSRINGTVGNMWCSDTHLFVFGNHAQNMQGLALTSLEHRYIGRFTLGSLTADGGRFLSEIWYNELDHYLAAGKYDSSDGRCYMLLQSFGGGSAYLYIDEDLDPASAQWYAPRPSETVAPSNNFYATPALLELNTIAYGDLSYANTEAGETFPLSTMSPDTGERNDRSIYDNGHSIWYRFHAPSTGSPTSTNYTISVGNLRLNQFGQTTYSIYVYTGSNIGSATLVAGKDQYYMDLIGDPDPHSRLSFDAISGTDYNICVRLYAAADVFGGSIQHEIINGQDFNIGQIQIQIAAT